MPAIAAPGNGVVGSRRRRGSGALGRVATLEVPDADRRLRSRNAESAAGSDTVPRMQHLCPIHERLVAVDETPYARDGWRLVRCRDTGLVFLPNPPAYEELSETYAWERTTVDEAARRRRREPVFSAFSGWWKRTRGRFQRRRNRIADLALHRVDRNQNRPSGGLNDPLRIVDIGCAGGDRMLDLCDRFARRGRAVVPIGLEISKALAGVAGPRFEALGGRVIAGSAVEGASRLPPESIDGVVMSAFLEHEAKPRTLLSTLRPSLRVGGFVVLKVPNFASWNRRLRGGRWCGFRYPDHVNYFTPATLGMLAEETGYRVLPNTWGDCMPLSDNMYATLAPTSPE